MPRNKLNSILCGIGVVALSWAAAVNPRAQSFDHRTYFTFSGPVELPGVGLGAGKYLFYVTNAESTSNVVRVVSADGKRVYGMFFTVASERLDAPEKPEMRFMETAAGVPPAVKTWWFPNDRRGHEFIYPRSQAVRLAKTAREPVLTTRAETTKTEETNTSDLARVSASGSNAGVAAAASTPSGSTQQGEPAPESVALAPARGPQPEGQVARASLPTTASAVPEVGLLGFFLVVAAGIGFGLTKGA